MVEWEAQRGAVLQFSAG